ncbi:RNA-binding protein 10 isoform X2 [Genypterus blacodes]|uniref:RNA-binding protein 10 isoform X2 n=1 Tax=Genypterus blacodes TaxID=154954 RepID=UPI003F76506C
MWDGPGQGPRGGPLFRGGHRGEMFGGRDRSMPDFRGRDGMNMSQMCPRPQDLPPMDMRRMDGPSMRGRDMDPRDMRGREPNRDCFGPGEEPDMTLRRQYEVAIRDKLVNSPGFPGPGRHSLDMGGRGMPPREQDNRFMDMSDRETFQCDMQRFNSPYFDGRRGFPLDRNDGFRDMRDRLPRGMDDSDHFNRDTPPRERKMMDFDGRGGQPFNQRGAFDSDVDFRNRQGPPAEYRGRDRSPLRFGNQTRSDVPSDVGGPQRLDFAGPETKLRGGEYHDSRHSPLMDYRSGEEMTLAEEWKNRCKEKNPPPNASKGTGGIAEQRPPMGFNRGVGIGGPPPFNEKDRPPPEFLGKDVSFPHGGHFPAMARPSIGGKAPQDHPLPEMNPLAGSPLPRGNESKHWLGVRDQKQSQNASKLDGRPTFHQEKSQPVQEIKNANARFEGLKDIPHSQGPARSKIEAERDFQGAGTVPGGDQDYRDIDYRTASGKVFDYKHEALQVPEKILKEAKPIPPSKFADSGSQDQDYRSATVEDKVSNTISIIGIPKTATMEQILGAFPVRGGVPMQGMKIKNVLPGYSYDTAYVEFLNREDAVHFMESNKGSLKVGIKTASMKYIQPDEHERAVHESNHNIPQLRDPQLPLLGEPLEKKESNLNGSQTKVPLEPLPHGQWQRSSDLTPEAWQQQVDQQLQQQDMEQQPESWSSHTFPHHSLQQSDPVFKDSKTMIIKNVKPTTTVDTILKALDPFAYLDERNVRLVKGKTPGAKCFCFVDMDSHEQVTRLVDLLTKPKPLYVDGVRVYAEVAKPLKNQNFRKDFDKPNISLLGHPPNASLIGQQHHPFPQPPQCLLPLLPPSGAPVGMQGELMTSATNPSLSSNPSLDQGIAFCETSTVDPSYQAAGPHVPTDSAVLTATADGSQSFMYSDTPDTTNYLYDATSGFFYDPETTFYYDPNSRYFYNAQTQEYMYWDQATKTYIPVPGGNSAESLSVAMTAEDQAILSNPAADAPLEMKKPSDLLQPDTELSSLVPASAAGSAPESALNAAGAEKKEDEDSVRKDKEEKPRSLAAVKIMKDMERWAKIQNRQKESVRAPSPLLKVGMEDERRQSKSADAAFAIFERKNSIGDDLFKKPLAPPKKDEKSKRPMGSLGLLASDYAAGSDEEIEEDKEDGTAVRRSSQSDDKEDKLTDWKKMACLLCRRQFPNKDALIRHQQLSDLHKQNMEIHLKIKRSKKELEALENQEKELNAKQPVPSPEQKKRKHPHPQAHHHGSWAGSSRDMHKVSERPGLGAEPVQKKKKESVVWDHSTYKQAVRKAMFARFKELE